MEKELWGRVQTILQERKERQIQEGALRALGMGLAAAAAGEVTSRYGPGAALPPGAGAALGAAWYIASGNAKKDWNHGKKKKEKKAPWPVVPYKPRFA